MSINGKFAFFGYNPGSNYIADVMIPFNTEATCTFAAKLWTTVYGGRADCYCIQDGHVGGRAFASFGDAFARAYAHKDFLR